MTLDSDTLRKACIISCNALIWPDHWLSFWKCLLWLNYNSWGTVQAVCVDLSSAERWCRIKLAFPDLNCFNFEECMIHSVEGQCDLLDNCLTAPLNNQCIRLASDCRKAPVEVDPSSDAPGFPKGEIPMLASNLAMFSLCLRYWNSGSSRVK